MPKGGWWRGRMSRRHLLQPAAGGRDRGRPHHAVAVGAAIQGAILAGEVRGPQSIDCARMEELARKAVREIGYEQAARIAKRAFAERRPVLDVAVEETGLPRDRLARLLDPHRLARPRGDH